MAVIETNNSSNGATRLLPKREVTEFIQLVRTGRVAIKSEPLTPLRERRLQELEEAERLVIRKCRGHIHPRDIARLETEIFQAREARRE